MDIEQARFNMVEQQIRPWDVLDQDILDLLFVVRREIFVPAPLRDLAFVDTAIPLSDSAAMLEPKIEARVLQELHVRSTDTVLEIGTGSGYMAALLGARASQVTTVEIDPALAERARENLVAAGALNVRVEVGDAAQGWPAHAPYDVIVVSGGLPVLPPELPVQRDLKVQIPSSLSRVAAAAGAKNKRWPGPGCVAVVTASAGAWCSHR